jgi:hypothetical protein
VSDTRDTLQEACRRITATLPPNTGFVLLAFDFDKADGKLEYASNAKREFVLEMMKDFIAGNQDPATWMKHVDDGPKPPGT